MKLLNFLKIKTYWFCSYQYEKDNKKFSSDLVVADIRYFWQKNRCCSNL
ncbi:hypothetical protein [Campylobacter novaezeelandiae]|nr:hypothetical protein [Campylobacter novaezeelandiae]